MEQRIGSSSRPLKAEPVTGAGFDPAYIPGLTAPASAQPEENARQQKAEKPPETKDAPSQDAAPAEELAEEPGTEEQSEEQPEEQPVDGPVFEAADRRARIVADHRGVHLSLDDQECEFRWDEIAAVETATSRFGKRFTVVVHTPEQRWYPIEIDAPARSRFAEWEKQLDAVLDAYFEDGEAEDKGDRGDRDEKDGDGRSEADKDTADESPAAGS
ncbi:hypothetical protein STXM2123_4048 [Streptomyces sp. F-3]|uniref:hypothetical protein n=1 Tax=unclassified Streptomyces TaxID=2593676 RepID=UPI0007C268C9|nr:MULTISPECIES: hypothetical protein [unclassified Streptomyces]MDN5382834.1 hypothetical protein [Streptomyces sp. LB8]GAT83347.1 hypothetical protein STXM2123_4048 [Streptomyces sp. F-3]